MHKIVPLLAATIVSSTSGFNFPIDDRPPIGFSRWSFAFSGGDVFSGGIEITSEKSMKSISNNPIITSQSSSKLASSSSSSLMITGEDYFSCPKYGPFSLNDSEDLSVTFTYELNTILSQTIIERIRLFKDGAVVSAGSNPSFSYVRGQRKEASFSIPVHDYMTASGLELRFEILNSSRTIIKAYSSSFYLPRNERIAASTLKSGIYTSNSLGFYGDGNQMQELREIYDFRNIGDYIDNDYYYRLDVTKNYFLYPNDFTLSYKSATLTFNDDDYLFPYYTHKDNGDIEIPLYLYKSNEHICFGFNKRFYVNKRTLDISDTYHAGWISTPYFYLPINGRKKFNNKILYFDLNELGYDKISTTIPLRCEINRTIVGVCSDGDYCIVGGNR